MNGSYDATDAFVIDHTEVITCPAVPEVRLNAATEVTALWQATEEFLRRHGIAPPFWAFPWPGGMALARHILDNPGIVSGKRVLDVGSGSGLVAIAAVLAGARAVTANEIDPLACRAIRLNAALNDVTLTIEDRDLTTVPEPGGGPVHDLIVAGDVCYERPMADALIGWLRRKAGRGVRVLLADPGRAYAPPDGLHVLGRYTVPTSRELEDSESREVSVFALLPDARRGDPPV